MKRDALNLSRIAHDLRGPLMPLRTAAWLLLNELDASPHGRELAQIVERQSARLARLLDELGDWGRNVDGPIALDRKPLAPGFALDTAIGAIPACTTEPRLAEAASTLQLHADPTRIAQLLTTLIEHAMQRAGGQSPEIDVSLEDGTLVIRVRDTGPALDEGARTALLEQPQASPFDGGLGLRMLLARRIAEAHGGSLAATQGGDGGLEMVCRLPAGAP